MKEDKWDIRPIGIIRTPYKEKAPYQGKFSRDPCEVEIFEEYEEGLKDVEGCPHLIVLYWLHKANRGVLQSHSPRDGKLHGVFATRSPNRPNPIGLCVAELIERRGRFLKVVGLDAFDGTPLIDIKPYFHDVDSP